MTVNLSTIIQAQRKVLTEGPCTQCGERDRRLCDCTIKTEATK